MEKNLVKIFQYVQKIPYQVCKFEKDSINKNLKFGDCRHKSELLYQLLKKENFEVKKIKVIFDWRDLPIPIRIISILIKSPTTWSHDALKVKIKDKWLKVDCTWNPELENKGFPITKDWDGKTDTKQITEGKLKFIDEDKFIKKIKIDLNEAKKFAEEINSFLNQ